MEKHKYHERECQQLVALYNLQLQELSHCQQLLENDQEKL